MANRRGITICLCLIGALIVAGASSQSFAAFIIEMTATGAQQGPILGDSTQAPYLNMIEVFEFHHLIDNTGGRATHEPIVFTKKIDRASPPFYTALANAESLSMLFRFVRANQSGTENIYYTVQLLGARIVAIEPITRNFFETASANLPDTERVRVTYTSIQVTYTSTGGTATLSNP